MLNEDQLSSTQAVAVSKQRASSASLCSRVFAAARLEPLTRRRNLGSPTTQAFGIARKIASPMSPFTLPHAARTIPASAAAIAENSERFIGTKRGNASRHRVQRRCHVAR